MGNLVSVYNWMKVRQGRVTYSMASRHGPSSYDCSSAISYAMREAGYNVPVMNTDSMFTYLPQVGFQRTGAPYKFGDIFIMGIQGSSSGANGHTGLFIDATNVIHCNYGANGISVNRFTDVVGSSPVTIFRDPNGGDAVRVGTDAPSVPAIETYLNTIEKQNAYEIYKLLTADGYTKQAIAGILGNYEVESGLKPDTDQIGGGGGYGLAQWTDPSGGSGRAYVQRLMSQAGITGDYRTVETQTKLQIWGMTHGQWIGVQDPTRVADFKALTDVNTATLAFLRNFERAGVAALARRQEAANTWYNFLTNLPTDESGMVTEPSRPTLENAGEVEAVYVMANQVRIVGWHFSSFGNNERLLIFDAQTDKEILRKEITLTEREDIAKEHEDIAGILLCGIDVTVELPEKGVFYGYFERYGSKTYDLKIADLIFTTKKITYAQPQNIPDFCGVFVEIIQNGEVIFETDEIIGELDLSSIELNQVPSLNLKIPCDGSFDLYEGYKEINIYFHGHIFNGLINDADKVNGYYELDIVHALDEWRYVQTPMNRAFKQATLPQVLTDAQIGFNDDWAVVFDAEATRFKFDYVFSKMNKLEVLDRIKEFSEFDWRVSLKSHRTLEIGVFGDKKEVYLSNEDECDATIFELNDTMDFSNIYNVLSVTSDSGDATESKTTLREVYLSKSFKKDFPVVITDYTANNEQKFYYTDITEIASNNSKEYMILDSKGIELNDNVVIEKTLSINDLSPITLDNEVISNEDRSVIVQQIYNQGVKELIRGRRRVDHTGRTSFMYGVNVGDRVYVSYSPDVDCGSCQSEIEGWFYVNSLGFSVKENTIFHDVELSTEKRIDE
ncbi:phage tail tip lysozyme [Enterococcus avium]|uniref:phage tail tip lysozyme n=1 Tax=Enterococcus avium TaxID=33945 RepID=UPI001F59D581|nr:phage tail tip lysozyme [Enterococcus avium]